MDKDNKHVQTETMGALCGAKDGEVVESFIDATCPACLKALLYKERSIVDDYENLQKVMARHAMGTFIKQLVVLGQLCPNLDFSDALESVPPHSLLPFLLALEILCDAVHRKIDTQ